MLVFLYYAADFHNLRTWDNPSNWCGGLLAACSSK